MNVSIIDDERVSDSKGGYLSHVDGVCELKNLQEFGELLTLCHIAPGTFIGNRKRQDHFKSIDCLCFDFDDGSVSAEEIHNQLRLEFDHVIAGSKNHLKDKGDGKGIIERFHVFVLTDVPITSVDLYKYMGKKFAKLRRWTVDENCIEPARYFFKHSSVLYVCESSGRASVDNFMKQRELEAIIDNNRFSKIPVNLTGLPLTTLERFNKTKYYHIMINGGLRNDGNRYDLSSRILGAMKTVGVTATEALAMFDEHSNYGKSFTRSSVERRIKQFGL